MRAIISAGKFCGSRPAIISAIISAGFFSPVTSDHFCGIFFRHARTWKTKMENVTLRWDNFEGRKYYHNLREITWDELIWSELSWSDFCSFIGFELRWQPKSLPGNCFASEPTFRPGGRPAKPTVCHVRGSSHSSKVRHFLCWSALCARFALAHPIGLMRFESSDCFPVVSGNPARKY